MWEIVFLRNTRPDEIFRTLVADDDYIGGVHGDRAAPRGRRAEGTLHPTPYTLHPTPYTLNPKPQTPNHTP